MVSSKPDRLRAEILKAIRDHAKANGGKPPGRLALERATGIKESAWRGVLWARWNDAVEEAGMAPNIKTVAIDENLLMTHLAEAIRHFGRLPTYSELRLYKRSRPGFPTDNTFQARFSTKENMLVRVRDWARDTPGFEDLLDLMPAGEQGAEQDHGQGGGGEGFVYLLGSGVHFKVGRSDQLERRVKEITVALPESVELVHSIRTDDPPGIEAYWHRRFADRRANGEWFKLTRADVAAFKRRKYQ
jgi:hypothetical protein